MDWKPFLGGVVLAGLVASPAFAQSNEPSGSDFTDLDDVTITLDDVSQDLPSAVETTPDPTGVGEATLGAQEERESAAGRSSSVLSGTSTHYVLDPTALNDGVVTEDEIRVVGAVSDPDFRGGGAAAEGLVPAEGGAGAVQTINPQSDPTVNPDAEPFIDPEAGGRIDPDALQKVDPIELERFADTRVSNIERLREETFTDLDRLRTSGRQALSNNQAISGRNVTVLNQRFTAIDNELSNLELAYGALGDRDGVRRVGEFRRGIRDARTGLGNLGEVQDPGEFDTMVDGFGQSISGQLPGTAPRAGAGSAPLPGSGDPGQ